MKITISNLQKKTVNQSLLKNQARKILRHEGVTSGELSLVLVNDHLIKKLNQKFLAKKYPTDVLAFNLSKENFSPPPQGIFGEIAISTDTAQRNSRLFHTNLRHEVTLYMVHGVLHLLGFDDKGRKKIKQMRRKESKLMAFLGML